MFFLNFFIWLVTLQLTWLLLVNAKVIKCRIEKNQADSIQRKKYHPIVDGGVGLACLKLKFFSLKIFEFFASDMSDQNSLLPREFIFPKEIKFEKYEHLC